MRTSERGYVVEGTARRQLLFSSCLPSREPPSFSSCPAVSPWNVHRRTSRCNLPYETCTYTCIHRAHILSPFLPRNTRTRVSFRISSGISPSFVRIRKSSTVQRLVSWMEIGIPLPLCRSQDPIVRNSKWRNRVTKRNRIWVIWTKDYITRLYNEIALALTPYHFSFSSRSIRHFALCIFRIHSFVRSFIPSKLFSLDGDTRFSPTQFNYSVYGT